MFYEWKHVSKEQIIILLEKIYLLFKDKNKWIDWPQAVSSSLQEVDPLDEMAVKWNLMGASFKIACDNWETPLANYVDCAAREFLNDISSNEAIHKLLPYEEEIALIELGLEFLKEDKVEND